MGCQQLHLQGRRAALLFVALGLIESEHAIREMRLRRMQVAGRTRRPMRSMIPSDPTRIAASFARMSANTSGARTGGPAMERWNPKQELSRKEEILIKRGRRNRKLFVFLRLHRHELFDETFQAELDTMYRTAEA